jgi:hypothetical protein
MTLEEAIPELDRMRGISREIMDVMALTIAVVQGEPLGKDETAGLVSVLENYRGLIAGALPPSML